MSVLVFCNRCYLIALASCALLLDEPRHIGGFSLCHHNDSLVTDVVVSNIPKAISHPLASTMHAHTRTHCGSVSPFLNCQQLHVTWTVNAQIINTACLSSQSPLSGFINQQMYWSLLNDLYCTSGKDKCNYFSYKQRNEKEVFIHKVQEHWIKAVVKSWGSILNTLIV